jgi:hypothetical protein
VLFLASDEARYEHARIASTNRWTSMSPRGSVIASQASSSGTLLACRQESAAAADIKHTLVRRRRSTKRDIYR